MKSLIAAGIAALAVACGVGEGPTADQQLVAANRAETAAPAPHLIYLHGKIIEDKGPRPTHPRHGVYEYQEILDVFAAAGLEVSSEQRPGGAVPAEHARATASKVRQLIADGVAPDDITVAGFSKGGAIAILTALELADPKVNFVFIACCGNWIDRLFEEDDREIRGRMLSIHEASDTVGSCDALFAHASPDSETAEITLSVGGGHGAFYRPDQAWVDPVVRWALHGTGTGDAAVPAALFTHDAGAEPSAGGGLSRGVAWGDFDNDGHPDLVVANAIGQEQMLYRNDGPDGFSRIAHDPIVGSAGDTEGAYWADYDNDGDLDLLLTNQFDQPLRLFRNEGPEAAGRDGTAGFAQVAAGDLGDNRTTSANGACWGDFDNDGHLDLFVVQRGGLDDLLFRNLGDGRFHLVTEGDAVANGGDGRTCACGDVDGDGDLDLFVGNFIKDEAKAPNFFYLNRGDATFEAVTEGEIVTDRQATYGSSFVDIDDDGDLDLFLSNIASSDHNALYLNDGRGRFSKRTEGELATAASRPSKGHAFGDYDNDGDLDLFIANGTEAEVDLRNFLYLNDGSGRFVPVTAGDLVETPNISAGAAWADMDLDGDLDLFVANWGNDDEDNALYRNNSEGKSWVVVRLTGVRSNRMGWGARVRVAATIRGSVRTQTRWMIPTTGYASQNEPIIHVGLGDADRIESLEVTWPSGTVDRLGPTGTNRVLEITEGQSRR